MKVIVCVPTGSVVPAAGLCVTLTDEQLSVATTPPVMFGTLPVPAVTDWLGAHELITGAVTSAVVCTSMLPVVPEHAPDV